MVTAHFQCPHGFVAWEKLNARKYWNAKERDHLGNAKTSLPKKKPFLPRCDTHCSTYAQHQQRFQKS